VSRAQECRCALGGQVLRQRVAHRRRDGCIPSYYPEPDSLQPGWPSGFYCPCHGSKFDLAGRVYRGSPAPTNLVIPPHRYLSSTSVLIGEEAEA